MNIHINRRHMKKILLCMLLWVMMVGVGFAGTPVIPDIAYVPVQGIMKVENPYFLPIPAPTWTDVLYFTSATAQTYTIPTNTRYLLISGNVYTYVNFTDTATVPTSGIINGSGSMLNLGVPISVVGLATVSIIPASATGGIVTIAAFK
jgi:hypothetical protein